MLHEGRARARAREVPGTFSTGQKKAASMNFSILSSRLARTRRDLANNSDKNQKFEKDMRKKIRLKIAISRAGTSAANS